MEKFELHQGDCLDVLRGMADNSVDSIVTDPPYGLSFMGKKWDYDVPSQAIWEECLRVLKPGGHLLAFAGTRTQHRMAVRIEDAGFEIRDMIAWVYGSGFPKSMDVSKAIDKAAGAEREVVGTRSSFRPNSNADRDPEGFQDRSSGAITAPATDAARQWAGWGTALKPALEPITVARKPFPCTVAANVLAHGTGAINIDACRVQTASEADAKGYAEKCASVVGLNSNRNGAAYGEWAGERQDSASTLGRWPANLLHDGSDEVVAQFPNSAGAGGSVPNVKVTGYGSGIGTGSSDYLGGERTKVDSGTGSAARFFFNCKSSYNDDLWQNLNLPPENANTAEQSSCLQRKAAVSALVLAANSVLQEGLLCTNLYMEPSTSATESELRLIASSVTQTIQSIGSRFWHESEPARLSLSFNRASAVAIQRLTDTTTITVSHWKSDGSADPVTFSIMRQSLEAGEKDCELFTASRFMYCAKSSKRDRDEGLEGFGEKDRHTLSGGAMVSEGRTAEKGKATGRNIHPTVKPTDLMAYLCRLVTPPGGVVLDPFMGSGSTGKAAIREGFRFIGCELSPEYLEIARARIEHELAKRVAASAVAEGAAPMQPDLFAVV